MKEEDEVKEDDLFLLQKKNRKKLQFIVHNSVLLFIDEKQVFPLFWT